MRTWIVTVGEPLPFDEAGGRLHRTGMVAETLRKRGHEVVWWASTLDHGRKVHRFDQPTTVTLPNGVVIRMLHGARYTKSVSFARIWNHRQIAAQFYREASEMPKPDVILASFPTVELAERSATFGREAGVPVVVDVRDLWPDIFVNYVPKIVRPFAPLLLFPFVRQARRAFRRCTSIIGITDSYLDFGTRYAGRARGPKDAIFALGSSRLAEPPADLEQIAATLSGMGVDPRKTICWFAGTFGMTYDLTTVIDCARMMETTHPDVQFVFSGQGHKFDEWFSRAQGLRNVIFTGWLNGGGLHYMSTIAKVGLAAYGQGAPQSLPNKIFEYLGAGLPILSSLDGECKEFLRSHGCGSTYVAANPASLLEQLRPYLEDEAHRAWRSANATRLFMDQFQATGIYGRMADHLETIARREAAKPLLESSEDGGAVHGFKGRLTAVRATQDSLPPGFRTFCWRPRLFAPFPPVPIWGLGPEKMISWPHLLYYYLHAVLQGMRGAYRVAAAMDSSGAVAAFAVATGRDFRFPFMGPRDAQLGPVWTAPEYRGQGIATALCRVVLQDLPADPEAHVWWFAWPDKLAAQSAARKLGLSFFGAVHRRRVLGLRKPHGYRLAT